MASIDDLIASARLIHAAHIEAANKRIAEEEQKACEEIKWLFERDFPNINEAVPVTAFVDADKKAVTILLIIHENRWMCYRSENVWRCMNPSGKVIGYIHIEIDLLLAVADYEERAEAAHAHLTALATLAHETHNGWPQIAEDLDAMNLQSATIEKIYTIELACPACSECLAVPQNLMTVWTLQDMINNDDTVICPACDTKCILHRDAFTLK